jgi:hypothetical protein
MAEENDVVVDNSFIDQFVTDILEGFGVPETALDELTDQEMLTASSSAYHYTEAQMIHAGMMVDLHEALRCMFKDIAS